MRSNEEDGRAAVDGQPFDSERMIAGEDREVLGEKSIGMLVASSSIEKELASAPRGARQGGVKESAQRCTCGQRGACGTRREWTGARERRTRERK
jgi:hypothetical protein